eukprot:TRINITY_DN17819_c0_g1_i1.p1 TRINITY_DN17819_c0_g1~~TRINITY_DN17819_c0_g1_i1.p1  ORF type:complete len:385 (-),score=53.94 TRINITY_DN17819_c0_g1_i1:197-1237(-)
MMQASSVVMSFDKELAQLDGKLPASEGAMTKSAAGRRRRKQRLQQGRGGSAQDALEERVDLMNGGSRSLQDRPVAAVLGLLVATVLDDDEEDQCKRLGRDATSCGPEIRVPIALSSLLPSNASTPSSVSACQNRAPEDVASNDSCSSSDEQLTTVAQMYSSVMPSLVEPKTTLGYMGEWYGASYGMELDEQCTLGSPYADVIDYTNGWAGCSHGFEFDTCGFAGLLLDDGPTLGADLAGGVAMEYGYPVTQPQHQLDDYVNVCHFPVFDAPVERHAYCDDTPDESLACDSLFASTPHELFMGSPMTIVIGSECSLSGQVEATAMSMSKDSPTSTSSEPHYVHVRHD